MSDLIDRQAAIDAFQMFRKYDSSRSNSEWIDRIEVVMKKQPTIDAVEVVRCKDCDFCICAPKSISGRKCNLRGDFVFTNDFCSYAVKRRIDERVD